MELYKHNGMELYVYDENVELVGVIDSCISLIWTDRYNRAGFFELYVTATEKNARLLKRFRYICRPEIAEKNIMYINGIQTKWSQDNGRCLIVTGYTADGLLRKRIMNLCAGDTLLSVLRTKMAELPIKKVEISEDNTLDIAAAVYDADRTMNAENWAYKAIKEAESDIALDSRADRANGRIVVGLRKGTDKSDEIIFSEENGNISSSFYAFSEEGCGNVVVAFSKAPAGFIVSNMPFYVHNGDITGVERTEIAIEIDPITYEVQTETGSYVVLDREATMKELKRQAIAATKPYTESFSAEANNIKGYREKWHTGDIIALKDDVRDTTYIKRIEEVKEVFDRSGHHVYPTFGDSIKTIYDIIKGR